MPMIALLIVAGFAALFGLMSSVEGSRARAGVESTLQTETAPALRCLKKGGSYQTASLNCTKLKRSAVVATEN